MSAPGTAERAAGPLICLMIVLSVLHGTAALVPAWAAGACAWTVGLLLVRHIGRMQQVQVAGMALVGSAGLAAAALNGDFSWWTRLLEGNQAILAMLATITFLRLVARTGAREDEYLPRGPGAVRQTLVATHLFSVAINISAAFVVGQRISADGTLTPLQAKVISRAFVAAACWSPFFASVAVVLAYVPGVDLARVAGVNVVLAILLVGFSALTLPRSADARTFIGYPVHAEALTLPALLAVTVVALSVTTDGLPILTVIVLASGVSVLALTLAGRRPGTRREFARHVRDELPRMGSEFALFLGAAVLAAGIAAAVRLTRLDLVVDPVTAADAIPLVVALALLSLVGVHPVISLATMSTLFPPELGDPDLVAMIVLMAWSVALSASPFSGATLALQGRFGIPAVRFLRWNASYVVFGLAAASIVLLGYGRFG